VTAVTCPLSPTRCPDRPRSGIRENPSNGRDKLHKLSQPIRHKGRSYPGFNIFEEDDDALFCTIALGEFHIAGMQKKEKNAPLAGKKTAAPTSTT